MVEGRAYRSFRDTIMLGHILCARSRLYLVTSPARVLERSHKRVRLRPPSHFASLPASAARVPDSVMKVCFVSPLVSSLLLGCHAALFLRARHPDDIGGAIAFNNQDAAGRYDFGYSEAHPSGATFRKESGDALGNKYGSYGLRDADGRLRIVNYVADENGFRADVRTNEPGVAPQDPASATINKPAALLLAPPPQVVAVPDLPSPLRDSPVLYRYVGPAPVRERFPKGYPSPPITYRYADPGPAKGYFSAPVQGKGFAGTFPLNGGVPVALAPQQYPYYGVKSLSGYPPLGFPL